MNKFVIVIAMWIVLYSTVPGLAQEVPRPVLDLTGNPLISGRQYLMMIANGAAIGVVQRNGTCPLYVIEQPLNTLTTFITILTNNVVPVINQISNHRILEGIAVSIKLASKLEFGCRESPVWQVVRNAIRTGGKQTESFFKIARVATLKGMANPVYKLQFCRFEVKSCQDIGKSLDFIDNLPIGPLLSPFIQGQNMSPLHIQFKIMS